MPLENTPATHVDAIVVGGSYSGLSAALQLARARRRVLVVDAGQRRNRFASSSHGFLGQDGRAPGDIAADGRAQLLAYPTVQWREGSATRAVAAGDTFEVAIDGGATVTSRRLVLATGVVDDLPPVEGLAERWGRSVFHCPYCHGYELGDGPIGVLASSAMSMHHGLMLPDWGRVTWFQAGDFVPDEAQRAALVARGVHLEAVPLQRLVDDATAELRDGRRVPMAGFFTLTRTRVASPLAAQLGCAFEAGQLGDFIRTDANTQETSVPGVFACGDAARAAGNVALAVGQGALAGTGAHQSLMFR